MGADDVPTMKQAVPLLLVRQLHGGLRRGRHLDGAGRTRCYGGGLLRHRLPAVHARPCHLATPPATPTEWTETERIIIERRSVRHYKDDPVPETLIRRVLEAGRFAPSGGNQPAVEVHRGHRPGAHRRTRGATQAVWAGDYFALEDEEVAAEPGGDPARRGLGPAGAAGAPEHGAQETTRLPGRAGGDLHRAPTRRWRMPDPAGGHLRPEHEPRRAAPSVWASCGATSRAMGVERTPELKARLGFDDQLDRRSRAVPRLPSVHATRHRAAAQPAGHVVPPRRGGAGDRVVAGINA